MCFLLVLHPRLGSLKLLVRPPKLIIIIFFFFFLRSLAFDSRFECGNLRQAYQMHETLYELILTGDVNTHGTSMQWFFFSVVNATPGVQYRFNIINCHKSGSQFGYGMQPVVWSRKTRAWCRSGTNVSYYKNPHKREHVTAVGDSNYYTASFNMTFESNEEHLVAYSVPYGYSNLLENLAEWQITGQQSQCLIVQTLCGSLAGNKCPLLTITALDAASTRTHPISERTYICLSARVHPGETNASFVMRGMIAALLSDSENMRELRKMCVFKIIPMLCVDGVVHGSNRCSLGGTDLNREW